MDRSLTRLLAGRARLAALVAVALAAGGTGAAVVVSNAASTTTLVTQTAQHGRPAAAPTPDDANEASEAATEAKDSDGAGKAPLTPVTCQNATSHGQYVSYIARSTEGAPDHAAKVREAAHSDCGKQNHGQAATNKTKTHGRSAGHRSSGAGQ